MKRRFLLCGLALICLAAMGVQALAAQSPVMLDSGAEITVSLKFSGEMSGLQGAVQWDPRRLELAEAPAYNQGFALGAMVAMLNPEPANGRLNMVYLRQNDISATDAEILRLKLRVKDAAAAGKTDVKIVDCRMADVDANAVKAVCEGIELQIGKPFDGAGTGARTASEGQARLYLVCENITEAVRPVPDIVLDVPEQGAQRDGIYLQTRNIKGGFAVDLIAMDVEIGGLQAEIEYDAASARLLTADFSDDFKANAMVNLVNCAEPGRIELVYSNVNGYIAGGDAIFTAQFAADETAKVSLRKLKHAGNDVYAPVQELDTQDVVWKVQPMDDLKIVEDSRDSMIEVADGYFSITMDIGESAALDLADGVCWISQREEIVSVTEDGKLTAQKSGLAELTAVDAVSGEIVAGGRVCVRNAQMGLPVEILQVCFDDGAGEVFSLAASDAMMANYAWRGISLHFCDAERSVIVQGLLPEALTCIPMGAFDLCESLVGVEIAGENISCIDAHAFDGCGSLEWAVLSGNVEEIRENAMPEHGRFTLKAPEGSAALMYAAENGLQFETLSGEGNGE